MSKSATITAPPASAAGTLPRYPDLTADDIRHLKTDPRTTPAHLAMLELLIEMGEITVVGGDA
jgi:hypothetical protein